MQKTKKNPAAEKAAAGKHVKTRKPLTDEQRARKNRRDRERRARLRNQVDRLKKTNCSKTDKNPSCKHGSCGDRCRLDPWQLFEGLAQAIAEASPMRSRERPESKPVQVEPGVVRREVSLPGIGRAVITVVDGSKVDPLSCNSPIPYPIRRRLLLERMAREVSDIVDASIAAALA